MHLRSIAMEVSWSVAVLPVAGGMKEMAKINRSFSRINWCIGQWHVWYPCRVCRRRDGNGFNIFMEKTAIHLFAAALRWQGGNMWRCRYKLDGKWRSRQRGPQTDRSFRLRLTRIRVVTLLLDDKKHGNMVRWNSNKQSSDLHIRYRSITIIIIRIDDRSRGNQ